MKPASCGSLGVATSIRIAKRLFERGKFDNPTGSPKCDSFALASVQPMLCNNVMRFLFADPLALTSGAVARLTLAAAVSGLVWAAVGWALLTP